MLACRLRRGLDLSRSAYLRTYAVRRENGEVSVFGMGRGGGSRFREKRLGTRQKKPGHSAPEQQRQEENGDAAALASHVPYIETAEMPPSSKNFSNCLPVPSAAFRRCFCDAQTGLLEGRLGSRRLGPRGAAYCAWPLPGIALR